MMANSDGAARSLFLANLETIDRAIRFACPRGRGGLRDEDAEDFASYVKLKLIENDYAIITKYEARSTFAAFISIVVQRMLLDYRIRQWGKWHASAEAKRLGEPALTIETMLHRDGRTIDEVLPALIRRWPELTREAVEAIVRRLPQRLPRGRTVDLDEATDLAAVSAPEQACSFASDEAEAAGRIAGIVRATLDEIGEQDRLIFRLRFEGDMTVAEVARVLRLEQKPLYRRLQRILALLRRRLEEAGVTADQVEDILSNRRVDLEFGFGAETAARDSSTGEEDT